ncbi:MAG: aldehyde dehydrogenase family protein [Candidatus Aenigmarchaeota archaeon]|nr:aldehyde dehydrogenase family protein [Candidatus Aenigmarchaeota archaeon]
MTKTYQLFIDGKWLNSKSAETFYRINPANPKEILGKFQQGTKDDIDKAVDAAEDAFGKWSSIPPPKRGEILFKIVELLRVNKERLARLMTKEMGKILLETRGDVQEAIDTFEYFAGEGRRLFGHTTTSELRDKFAMTIRRPVGVFGIITPWNFPIAIPAWKLAPALICGNTVVWKPSSDTPLCAIELMKILTKAGISDGVVNLVTGPGNTAGMHLVKHKKVRGISFTGNRDTGKQIVKEAGIKKVGLELGSKNAMIIMDDANLKLALDGVIWGAFGTTGQRCTATSRVIIHETIRKRFEKTLVERVKKLRLGSGLNPRTDVGPLVNKAAREKSARYTKIGMEEGGKLICGGKIPKLNGFFFQPTVFTDVAIDMKIAKEEIFGPVVSLIPVKNLNEAIKAANSVEYGLSSSIYTNDIRTAFEAIEKIEAGITYVNAPTIGAEVHLPFGGVKSSGQTREAGWAGVEEFSEEKTVYIDYSNKLQRAQIDTK